MDDDAIGALPWRIEGAPLILKTWLRCDTGRASDNPLVHSHGTTLQDTVLILWEL